jgi:hypothetical protein
VRELTDDCLVEEHPVQHTCAQRTEDEMNDVVTEIPSQMKTKHNLFFESRNTSLKPHKKKIRLSSNVQPENLHQLLYSCLNLPSKTLVRARKKDAKRGSKTISDWQFSKTYLSIVQCLPFFLFFLFFFFFDCTVLLPLPLPVLLASPSVEPSL